MNNTTAQVVAGQLAHVTGQAIISFIIGVLVMAVVIYFIEKFE